jgi:hypothetical protein
VVLQITVNNSEDAQVALVHHVEVNLLNVEVLSVDVELHHMEVHLEHQMEDAQVALVHHVEVLLLNLEVLSGAAIMVKEVILDAIVVKMVMFLTIIMVLATDVQTFTVKALHMIVETLVEGTSDTIQEPVVFQVAVVNSANPAYVDN